MLIRVVMQAYNIWSQAALSIDNVAYEPSTVFFRRFPRVGALHAAAVCAGGAEAHALLCADTLLPRGSGAPLAAVDRCGAASALQAREFCA